MPNYDRIKQIKDFESLVEYLRDELDWPIDTGSFQDESDWSYDWEAEELGLDKEAAVKVRQIKQLRPLPNQPWGVFFIDFDSKRLPVVVMRKVLRGLVVKKRGGSPGQPAWNADDLLFISAMGEDEHRGMTFAHFRDNGNGTPVLQTFSWDDRETHFHYIETRNLASLGWPQDGEVDAEAWRKKWSGAFTAGHRESIGTSKELSKELARLAKRTRDFVLDLYAYESKNGPLHKLHKSFRTVLIHDLDERRFSDMVAQTIAYGLFSSRATGEKVLGLKHLEEMVPNTNPFLRDLFAEFTKLGGSGKNQIDFDELGVSELVDMLNDANMRAVLEDFGRQTGGGQEDPVIHFYELFLREYDKEQKVQRGVFYTPKPVVSFIVRSVDRILRDEFHLDDGLADTTTWAEMVERDPDLKRPPGVSEDSPFVQILDPACGTGTFLVEVIDIIHDTMLDRWCAQGMSADEVKDAWNEYVPNHLLPRLYGFELMMAPYVVAHLKLGLKLKDTGYRFDSEARLRVYLTNALEEPGSLATRHISGFLASESEAANVVKRDEPVTVVIGNPPYSYMSANMTDAAATLVEPFRYVDGERIKERSALSLERSLQDDFVKFYGAALRQAEKHVACFVLGFITNNSYLDTPLLRGLRASLLAAFPAVTIVDLFGDSIKDGEKNVFDIQQGVAIGLWRRGGISHRPFSGFYAVHGNREDKYAMLRSGLAGQPPIRLSPKSPHRYLFPVTGADHYLDWRLLTDTFPLTSTCIKTLKDDLATDFDRDAVERNLEFFRDPSIPQTELERRFGIADVVQWRIAPARGAVRELRLSAYLASYQARPFDYRWMFYHPAIVGSPRHPIMRHIQDRRNVALISNRKVRTGEFRHAFVTPAMCVSEVISSADNSNCFPLYLYQDADDGLFGGPMIRENLFDTQADLPLSRDGRTANLSPQFQAEVAKKLSLSWLSVGKGDLKRTLGPEDAFNYIYAVLHSPGYRSRYAEFLKIDFPRIPLTTDLDLFRSLCTLGGELVGLHLMEKHAPLITTFEGTGDGVVEKVRYAEPLGTPGKADSSASPRNDYRAGRVYINQTQYFEGVPPEVWEFHIGGYQVCEKWLKDRGPKKGKPGRELADEDILHYQRVVAALKETIRLMSEIDNVIESHGGWPLPGSVPTDPQNTC